MDAMPGMPFYSEASARAFVKECHDDCPMLDVQLVRRQYLSGIVEVIETIKGKTWEEWSEANGK